MANTGMKFVKKAGMWCVWTATKNKDNKQIMTTEWKSTKEQAQEVFDKLAVL